MPTRFEFVVNHLVNDKNIKLFIIIIDVFFVDLRQALPEVSFNLQGEVPNNIFSIEQVLMKTKRSKLQDKLLITFQRKHNYYLWYKNVTRKKYLHF
jgi:hypothetical protein